MDKRTEELIDKAVEGDKEALEHLLSEMQDMIYNLSLRMLGTIPDAEDASQEILVRIMTNLSSFRKESSFQTWVYRVAVNYLLNYKKSMFAQRPLNFEFYGDDIAHAQTDEVEELVAEIDRKEMAEELKMSCTNVMLQCLDAQSRCIFIFGTMFKLDSRIAGEVLGMTPENYRQRLSRIRRKMADFLAHYCGLTKSGMCSCEKRLNYAVSQGRINPKKKQYVNLKTLDKEKLFECKEEMEQLDELSDTFEGFPYYQSAITARQVVDSLMHSKQLKRIQEL